MKKLLVLLTILSSIMAYAEDTIELDQTTVKSSPRSSDYTLIPKEQKNTYVITQEKIRERNYKNVEDVLRDAPGVTIQNTAFGPRVDMRGSGEKSLSRVKVLIDGVSINPTEETMASLPINSIPIESVKKIEIIPGGGATLYGSGSVGGVISITTNSNVTKNNFFADLNYGSFDNRNFGFAGGYNVTKNLYVNYGFSYLNSEGYRREEEKENKIYLLGFDYKINAKNRFRFQTRYSKFKDDGSNQVTREVLEYDRRAVGLNLDMITKDKSYTFDYEYRPKNNLTLAATIYKQEQDRDIQTESIDDIRIVSSPAGYTYGSYKEEMNFYGVTSKMNAKFEEDKKGLKLKSKYDYSNGQIIFGYDYQKAVNKRDSFVQSETLKSYNNGYSNKTLEGEDIQPVINRVKVNMEKESHGFYVFNKFDATDKLDITTGFRTEITKYNGKRVNGPNTMPFVAAKTAEINTDRRLENYAGEFGALYKYRDTGRVFLRYEKGFVTPFANQLTDKVRDTTLPKKVGFFDPPQVNVASKYVDNNLKSEKTDTVELGVRDYFFGSLFSASVFLTDTKDEITLISSGVTNPAVNRWKYRNIGKTRRMGLELEAEQNFGNWSLSQSLTLLNTKVLKANEEARLEKGDQVPLVPRVKATLGVKYNFTDKIALVGTYTYFSKRDTREIRESEDLNKDDDIIKHTIGGYGVTDLGVLYKADAYSNIKVGAKNIFNKKYNLRETSLEALPAPEKTYYLEMNVRF